MDLNLWNEIMRIGAYSAEFDWFAADRAGHVGVFTAVALAPIPDAVRASYENYERISRAIDALPKRTSAVVITREKMNITSWTRSVEAGLFAFDFHRSDNENDAQYDLLMRPAVPLHVSQLDLPADLLVVLNCDFGEGDVHSVAELSPRR